MISNYEKFKSEIAAVLNKNKSDESFKINKKIKDKTETEVLSFLDEKYIDTEPKKITRDEKQELEYMYKIKKLDTLVYDGASWYATNVFGKLVELEGHYITCDLTQQYNIPFLISNNITDVKLLDYLQFNSSAYFDTLITNSSDISYEVKISGFNDSTILNNKCVVGARESNVSKKNYIYLQDDLIAHDFSNRRRVYKFEDVLNKKITIKTGINSTQIKIDSESYTDFTKTVVESFEDTRNIYIGALNNGSNGEGVATNRFAGQLNYCKIYKNGVLIADYKPALNEENTYCLYDILNNTFLMPIGNLNGGDY